MSEIERITKEEFESIRGTNTVRGSASSKLTLAIKALEPGESIKVDCTWNHWARSCGGSNGQHMNARAQGYKILTSCKDGVLYIQKRIPEEK